MPRGHENFTQIAGRNDFQTRIPRVEPDQVQCATILRGTQGSDAWTHPPHHRGPSADRSGRMFPDSWSSFHRAPPLSESGSPNDTARDLMTGRPTGAVLKHLRILFDHGSIGGLSDGQLLDRFGSDHDEAAFAALVERHGPMVLRLSRQVIGDEHEAQDAAQAVFLVPARRAGSIRRRDSVASWLYRVARRIASRARVVAARRRETEWRGGLRAVPRDEGREAIPRTELYEELDRLPERYRAPLVLCHLEGLTHEQAAQRLRCPLRTVQTRLLRA